MLIPKSFSYCFIHCHTTTTTILLSSSSSSSSLFNNKGKFHLIPRNASSSPLTSNTNRRRPRVSTTTTTTATTSLVVVSSSSNDTNNSINNNGKSMELDCFGTGLDVECVVSQIDETDPLLHQSFQTDTNNNNTSILTTTINDDEDAAAAAAAAAAASTPPLTLSLSLSLLWDWALLISPFFFWGTAMVAMKQVLPKAGPFFVSTFRLIPAGFLLVAFAASTGRKQPSGTMAWLSISLFALIDATCFQGFLAQGLQRTSAGLGSVIIDSQPLTVAVLATLSFGESIGVVGVAGLVLGVVGLLLLEVPVTNLDGNDFSLWGNGEWWMLLAAQSMAVGTVMVRWVSKYSDPVMATGWHMVIGGIPLVVISVLNHDPAISGSLKELTSNDLLALLYTSVFGSAISYGVYFYNATRGSLTKLSSLTFLTPMFASVFGFLYLGETFSPVQVVGALVTVVSIYLVNYRSSSE